MKTYNFKIDLTKPRNILRFVSTKKYFLHIFCSSGNISTISSIITWIFLYRYIQAEHTHFSAVYFVFIFCDFFLCLYRTFTKSNQKEGNECAYVQMCVLLCILDDVRSLIYIWWRKKRCMDEIRDQQWRLLFNLFRFSFSDFLWASNVIFYVEMKLVLVDRLIFNDELIKLLKDSF